MSRSSFHSLLAAALALLAGCATAGGGGGPAEPGVARVKVLLAAKRGCCEGEPSAGLTAALARRADVRRVALRPSRDDAARVVKAVKATRAATAHARQLYLAMRMDAADEALQRALKRVRAVKARGMIPADLGAIYLLLAAVSDARGRREDAKRFARAAVRFDPAIEPDPDTFPPPVREAVAAARRDRKLVNVSIQSKPSGASVTWDGRAVGRAPVKIPQQGKGEHFLLVEHPLRAAKEEVIYLSTNASLQVELEPASPEAVAGALARDPALADDGLAALGVQSVVWLEEAEGGVAARVHAVGRAGRSFQLGATATRVELDQVVAAAVVSPIKEPSAPARQPSVFRRYWWAWTLGAAAVIAAGIAIPVVASAEEDPGARGVRLDLP